MLKVMIYSFSFTFFFLLQKDYMAQSLQTASSATHEQHINLLLHKKSDYSEGEKERESKESQKLRNKDKED